MGVNWYVNIKSVPIKTKIDKKNHSLALILVEWNMSSSIIILRSKHSSEPIDGELNLSQI